MSLSLVKCSNSAVSVSSRKSQSVPSHMHHDIVSVSQGRRATLSAQKTLTEQGVGIIVKKEVKATTKAASLAAAVVGVDDGDGIAGDIGDDDAV